MVVFQLSLMLICKLMNDLNGIIFFGFLFLGNLLIAIIVIEGKKVTRKKDES